MSARPEQVAVASAIACLMSLGCGTDPHDGRLQVTGPSDPGCLGVVGFDIEVMAGQPRHYTQMLKAPVLEPAQCRLDSLDVSGIDVDVPITVTIDGYDSQRKPVVHGSAAVGKLRAPSADGLMLRQIGSGAHDVLLVDRGLLLGTGGTLGDVTNMVITTAPPKPVVLLSVSADDAAVRPFFQAAEPGAFVLDGTVADGEKVSVTLTTAQGSNQSTSDKLQISRQGGGTVLYLQSGK